MSLRLPPLSLPRVAAFRFTCIVCLTASDIPAPYTSAYTQIRQYFEAQCSQQHHYRSHFAQADKAFAQVSKLDVLDGGLLYHALPCFTIKSVCLSVTVWSGLAGCGSSWHNDLAQQT